MIDVCHAFMTFKNQSNIHTLPLCCLIVPKPQCQDNLAKQSENMVSDTESRVNDGENMDVDLQAEGAAQVPVDEMPEPAMLALEDGDADADGPNERPNLFTNPTGLKRPTKKTFAGRYMPANRSLLIPFIRQPFRS